MQISLSILQNIFNLFYFDSQFFFNTGSWASVRGRTPRKRLISRLPARFNYHHLSLSIISFVFFKQKKVRKLSLALLCFDAMVLKECLERTHHFKLQLIFDFGFTLLLQLINLRDVFLCALVIFHLIVYSLFVSKFKNTLKTVSWIRP